MQKEIKRPKWLETQKFKTRHDPYFGTPDPPKVQ